MEHPLVAEAAVVGCPHEVKGEAVYAFVIPKQAGGEYVLYIHSLNIVIWPDSPAAIFH